MTRYVSLLILLLLIVLLGSTLYQVVAPFLLPLFLAAVLSVVCQPMHQFFLRLTGNRTVLSAAISTATLVAMLVVPTVVVTFICAFQMYSLGQQHLDGDWHRALDLLWNHVVTPAIDLLKQIDPGELSDERINTLKVQFADSLQSLSGTIASRTFQIASSTVGLFVSLTVAAGMFITALYYFLADGPSLIAVAEKMIPLPADHQRKICERFSTVVRAVVTATFLAAFCQGFATAIALQLCGIRYFWVFLALASFMSLIPLVGAWVVWGPCVIWLAVQGHWGLAIGLAIWGAAVVSLLDNVVKMYVLQSDADLHPLLAFVSVVGALQVLGLWGIFIGPIVASCLFAIIQIFNDELKSFDNQPPALATSKPPTEADVMVPVVTETSTVAAPPTKPSTGHPSKQRKASQKPKR